MIPYGRQLIGQDDIDAVVDVLRGDYLTCGPLVDKFEDQLAKIINAKQVISCSNGTTALHLALLAMNIGSNDVVLVPAITFLASANAARYVGADVVFVDVDPNTGLMTANTLLDAIEQNKAKKLKAVVNVHLAGQCENLEEIYKVAKKYNLLIIEDAAHAVGSVYIDKNNERHPIGSNSFSDITTFSFHPVKTIAMGEGGAVSTNDIQIAKRLKTLRSHGMLREVSAWTTTSNTGPWYYEMQDLGYNYRISDINCALGVSQLKKIEHFKAKRASIVRFYDSQLAQNEYINPTIKLQHSDTAWHLYIVLIDFAKLGMSRSEYMQKLKKINIGTQVHYIPVYKQPYYTNLYGALSLSGSESYYNNCLSLPLYVGLSESMQEEVIAGLINV